MAKSSSVAAAPAVKAPGVIESIVEILEAAGAASEAVSKAEIASALHSRFPDREYEKLLATVGTQVPGRIRRERDKDVQKSADGYFIPVIKPAPKRRRRKASAKKS